MHGLVLIADGPSLTGLNNGGAVFLACQLPAFYGDSAHDVERVIKNERFRTRPMRLGKSQIVAGCKWYDGRGILILGDRHLLHRDRQRPGLAGRSLCQCHRTGRKSIRLAQSLAFDDCLHWSRFV